MCPKFTGLLYFGGYTPYSAKREIEGAYFTLAESGIAYIYMYNNNKRKIVNLDSYPHSVYAMRSSTSVPIKM